MACESAVWIWGDRQSLISKHFERHMWKLRMCLPVDYPPICSPGSGPWPLGAEAAERLALGRSLLVQTPQSLSSKRTCLLVDRDHPKVWTTEWWQIGKIKHLGNEWYSNTIEFWWCCDPHRIYQRATPPKQTQLCHISKEKTTGSTICLHNASKND